MNSSSTSGLAKFRSIWSSEKVAQRWRVPRRVGTGTSSGELRGRTTAERSVSGSISMK